MPLGRNALNPAKPRTRKRLNNAWLIDGKKRRKALHQRLPSSRSPWRIFRNGISPLWGTNGESPPSSIHFAHFKRVWGNPPIHTLTVEVLDQYRALRLSEKVGPATINREMATLKHALSKAVEWKLLRKTAREELTAIKKYQEPDGRLRYLSGEAEADRLLQACERLAPSHCR